jgi:hypothetical protein
MIMWEVDMLNENAMPKREIWITTKFTSLARVL